MKTPLPAVEVAQVAEELRDRLRPFCERIEVAGSLRRGKPIVSDIELVMVPHTSAILDLFGEPTGHHDNYLFDELSRMRNEGILVDRPDKHGRPAFGERFQRVLYKRIPTDLFSVFPPAQWGVIYLIRTGPAEFNMNLVKPRHQGGLQPTGIRIEDGQVHDRGQALRTPEEIDVFNAYGIPYIEPRNRR